MVPRSEGPLSLLLYGAPDATPDLFRVVPVLIVDAFLYAEVNGRRAAVIGVLDAERARRCGVETIDPFELGMDELLADGLSPVDREAEIALRACGRLGIEEAIVPPGFPLALADRLRAGGIELRVDPEAFAERRRVKSEADLAGIRRAQAAADAAMAVAAGMIRELRSGLTSEEVRAAMRSVCDERGCDLPENVIVSAGAQGAVAHEPGHGPIAPGAGVIVDIWPRDRASRCWADMTRTFVAGGGEPSSELHHYWSLAHASLERVSREVAAGVECRHLYDLSCEPFEANAIPTQRTKPDGEALDEGYHHTLGHGVGLELHEPPRLGPAPGTLVAGEVVTLEPGCYRKGFGGVRLEDLVLVVDGGMERLTDFPYEL